MATKEGHRLLTKKVSCVCNPVQVLPEPNRTSPMASACYADGQINIRHQDGSTSVITFETKKG